MAIEAQVPASAELELYEDTAHTLELNFGDVSLRPQKVAGANTVQLVTLARLLHNFTSTHGTNPRLDELKQAITATFNSPMYWAAKSGDSSMFARTLTDAISNLGSDLENAPLLEGIIKSSVIRGKEVFMNVEELHALAAFLFAKSRFDLLRSFTEALTICNHPLADQIKSDYVEMSQIYTIDHLSRKLNQNVDGEFLKVMPYAATAIYDFQTQSINSENIQPGKLDFEGLETPELVKKLAKIMIQGQTHFGIEVLKALAHQRSWDEFPQDLALELLSSLADLGKLEFAEQLIFGFFREAYGYKLPQIQIEFYSRLLQSPNAVYRQIAEKVVEKINFEQELIAKLTQIEQANSAGESGVEGLKQLVQLLKQVENAGINQLNHPHLRDKIRWYFDFTSSDPITPNQIDVKFAIGKLERYISLCERVGMQLIGYKLPPVSELSTYNSSFLKLGSERQVGDWRIMRMLTPADGGFNFSLFGNQGDKMSGGTEVPFYSLHFRVDYRGVTILSEQSSRGTNKDKVTLEPSTHRPSLDQLIDVFELRQMDAEFGYEVTKVYRDAFAKLNGSAAEEA